jgi:hypothetical protein
LARLPVYYTDAAIVRVRLEAEADIHVAAIFEHDSLDALLDHWSRVRVEVLQARLDEADERFLRRHGQRRHREFARSRFQFPTLRLGSLEISAEDCSRVRQFAIEQTLGRALLAFTELLDLRCELALFRRRSTLRRRAPLLVRVYLFHPFVGVQQPSVDLVFHRGLDIGHPEARAWAVAFARQPVKIAAFHKGAASIRIVVARAPTDAALHQTAQQILT